MGMEMFLQDDEIAGIVHEASSRFYRFGVELYYSPPAMEWRVIDKSTGEILATGTLEFCQGWMEGFAHVKGGNN